MTDFLTGLVLTGVGGLFAVSILSRLIPNKQLRAFAVFCGKCVTGFGRSKLGKGFWEKMESYVKNSIEILAEGFIEGLESDDGKEKK